MPAIRTSCVVSVLSRSQPNGCMSLTGLPLSQALQLVGRPAAASCLWEDQLQVCLQVMLTLARQKRFSSARYTGLLDIRFCRDLA